MQFDSYSKKLNRIYFESLQGLIQPESSK